MSETTHFRFCAMPYLRRSANTCPRISRSPRLAGRRRARTKSVLTGWCGADYSGAARIERVGAEGAIALGKEGRDADADAERGETMSTRSRSGRSSGRPS